MDPRPLFLMGSNEEDEHLVEAGDLGTRMFFISWPVKNSRILL